MRSLLRRNVLVVFGIVVVFAVIAALAAAAGKPPTTPNNPSITFVSPSPAESASDSDGNVTFAFTYNRTPKQTATVTCALTGQGSQSCDAPVAFPSNSTTGSKSGKAYTGLANGNYT